MSVCIVDYNMGNLRSVKKALDRIGVTSVISSDPGVLKKSDKVILPGVGHFARGMQNLRDMGLKTAIIEEVTVRGKPILGICLGMQLLTKSSEEGDGGGLGLVAGHTIRFPEFDKESRLRVPHIGWNTVDFEEDNPLFNGIESDATFYFVHSYYVAPWEGNERQSITSYGIRFVAAVADQQIFGTQFHPEKSYDAGLQLLRNFCES